MVSFQRDSDAGEVTANHWYGSHSRPPWTEFTHPLPPPPQLSPSPHVLSLPSYRSSSSRPLDRQRRIRLDTLLRPELLPLSRPRAPAPLPPSLSLSITGRSLKLSPFATLSVSLYRAPLSLFLSLISRAVVVWCAVLVRLPSDGRELRAGEVGSGTPECELSSPGCRGGGGGVGGVQEEALHGRGSERSRAARREAVSGSPAAPLPAPAGRLLWRLFCSQGSLRAAREWN